MDKWRASFPQTCAHCVGLYDVTCCVCDGTRMTEWIVGWLWSLQTPGCETCAILARQYARLNPRFRIKAVAA